MKLCYASLHYALYLCVIAHPGHARLMDLLLRTFTPYFSFSLSQNGSENTVAIDAPTVSRIRSGRRQFPQQVVSDAIQADPALMAERFRKLVLPILNRDLFAELAGALQEIMNADGTVQPERVGITPQAMERVQREKSEEALAGMLAQTLRYVVGFTRCTPLTDKDEEAIRRALHLEEAETTGAQQPAYAYKNPDMTEEEYAEVLDCLMTKGFNGKMGQHSLMSLARSGNPVAQFEVGEMNYYGTASGNHLPDYAAAREWYLKAAQRNHPGATWTIGYMIMQNLCPHHDDPADIDYSEARYWLNRAMEAGSPAAMTSMGQLWEEGHYPRRDYSDTRACEPANVEKALKLYRRAAKMKYHFAYNRLGLYYATHGDDERAIRAFKISVSLVADGYSLNYLGRLYERDGKGADRACEYYLKAVQDVLPADVTAWGLFNAGRARTNRVPGQSLQFVNYREGFSNLMEAHRRQNASAQRQECWQMLQAMLEALLNEDLSSVDVESRETWATRARCLTEQYLRDAAKKRITIDEEHLQVLSGLLASLKCESYLR